MYNSKQPAQSAGSGGIRRDGRRDDHAHGGMGFGEIRNGGWKMVCMSHLSRIVCVALPNFQNPHYRSFHINPENKGIE